MAKPSETGNSLVHPPRQERSRATLERILEATEALLEDRMFEEIPLGDVLERSGVSVGAFYTRFSSRDALLPCLYDRYDRRITAAAGPILDPERWRGRGLEARVKLLFRYATLLYRHNRGLLRALTLRARTHPGDINLEQRAHRTDLWEATAGLLLECRDEVNHPEPEVAVRLGLLMTGATMRDKILYQGAPHPGAVAIADRRLARELARAFLAYVGCKRSEPV